MNTTVDTVLNSNTFSKEELLVLLRSEGEQRIKLFEKASEIKRDYVGNIVYFRGLIEYSNRCVKDCYYCGIRRHNETIARYTLTEEEVLHAVEYAYKERYASLVIQGGELQSSRFTDEITRLLYKIGEITQESMGITLSLGEQSRESLQAWKNAGAKRYLLRIETATEKLYKKMHPKDNLHSFKQRVETLALLREIGYQTGTGVMIGLPFQSLENMADDLLFFRDLDVDMVGMGPYIEHKDTPLYRFKDTLLPQKERFDLTLKMIAILRIMMKDINIVATTAMQAIDPIGREKALKVGANIIMPNLTPQKYRGNYLLYEDKPCIDEEAEQCKSCLEMRIHFAGDKIGYGQWGDSNHFAKRTTF
jgi:biotin synthase